MGDLAEQIIDPIGADVTDLSGDGGRLFCLPPHFIALYFHPCFLHGLLSFSFFLFIYLFIFTHVLLIISEQYDN